MNGFKILAMVAVLAFATTTFAASTADIIFVVDESGSMGGEHAWLGTMVTSLEAELVAAGVTGNQYGLVGFGGSSPHYTPHGHAVGGGDWGTAAQFSTAAGTLVTTGGTEDGWAGITYALNNYAFRQGAAINIVLVTDEDRDNTTGDTYSSTLGLLNRHGALLNVVVDASFRDGAFNTALGIDWQGNAYIPDGGGGYTSSLGGVAVSGWGTTIADYVNMAIATKAAAWDLNQLRAGGLTADSFTAAFVDVKVEEIVIPEPSSILLIGGGLGLLGLMRRRRRA